jgi:hypothetical protein
MHQVMKRKNIGRLFLVLLALLAAVSAWLLIVTPAERDRRAEINSYAFDDMGEKTPWDLKKPMLWGCFFTSKAKVPLMVSRCLLGFAGFRFVDLSRDENELWWLHLECVEVHDVNSLSVRDVRLSRFGSLTFSDYDGWDVGPVKPIHANK